MNLKSFISFFIAVTFIFCGCNPSAKKEALNQYQPKEYVQLQHPEWTKNATLYEVNLRQYSKEGSFRAFEKQLGRLKNMGVTTLWLMPINTIGIKNRKGSLGSEYSVKDYYGVNPEFGTLQDLEHLVDTVHSLGMHVILDWVANHSAWDNKLVLDHPEWYIKNRTGNFESTPWRDYDDIIDFDYSQPGLREYMVAAMKYWVKETDIDGFRCDVASFIPVDFWEEAREELQKIKPVFMLAEAADRDLHARAFDATYSWALWDLLHNITTKHAPVDALAGGYIAEHVSTWPRNAYRMNFIDNHDKNSWEGNMYSNFGPGLHAAIALTCTMDGIPMMYSGQEAGLNRSLAFFDKDEIEWKKDTVGGLYSKLFNLKQRNEALWNGKWGGEMLRIKNNKMQQVLSFVRQKNNDKVLVIANLSEKKADAVFETALDKGQYRELLTSQIYILSGKDSFKLGAWNFLVLEKVD